MDFEALNEFLIQRRIRFKKDAKTAQYVSIKVGGIASFITFPDTIEKYQFTKGYYSREYVSFESEEKNFPTFRFKHK